MNVAVTGMQQAVAKSLNAKHACKKSPVAKAACVLFGTLRKHASESRPVRSISVLRDD
jgi:hypothetical protein